MIANRLFKEPKNYLPLQTPVKLHLDKINRRGMVYRMRKFAYNARFLFCKDGAIYAKNSPKRTSHGVARAIVKGTSLRSPSPIMSPD